MSNEFDFNLMDDPWLPYVTTEGDLGTGSIRYVLEQAHEIRDLITDVPTQYPPILRMLVTVLHRALADKDAPLPNHPRTSRQWEALYAQAALPGDKIRLYADMWRDRFGLFDEQRPFFQVGADRLTVAQEKTAALLVSDASSGNNVPLFSTQRDETPVPLSPAQAARWLLHVHAWDTAGIKTGAKEDPRARAGKTTGNHNGPLGDLGVLIPAGNTLRETLLFNLLVLDKELTGVHDLPLWEHEEISAEWSTRVPLGLLDRYTWSARRVRLVPEADEDGTVTVLRALVCAGDRVEPVFKPQSHEPHSAWLRNKPKTENAASEGADKPRSAYRPHRHVPGKQLWRGLGGILGRDQALNRDSALKPPVLRQLSDRFDEGETLPVLQLRAYGISYGLQNAVIDDTYFDSLPLPVAALMEGGSKTHELGQVIVKCVANTEEAASALGHFAANLAFAEGGAPDTEKSARDRIIRQYFAVLDQEFRSWLGNATNPDEVDEYREEWHRIARREAWKLARESISRTGPRALRTRYRKEKTKKGEPIGVNLVIARRSLSWKLRTHLGTEEK